MKKVYISPHACIIEYDCESFIASSFKIDIDNRYEVDAGDSYSMHKDDANYWNENDWNLEN